MQAVNATTARRGQRLATDEVARRTLVASDPADALYGTDASRARYHHVVVYQAISSRPPILALELLKAPDSIDRGGDSTGWLAVHISAPRSPSAGGGVASSSLAITSELLRGGRQSDHPLWDSIHRLLPDDVEFRPEARVRTVSFASLEPGDVATISERSLVAGYLLITSASPDQVFDLSQRALRYRLTMNRPDWSALILRDGMAFVAHQQSDEAFAETLRTLTHSVHLDALLLALMQRHLVDRFGAEAVKASVATPKDLVKLECAYFDFKRKYWRTSLTEKRTSPSDEVLRGLQAEFLTALDVEDVEQRVRDGARLARSLHDERQQEGQDRLTKMVRSASIIIGALTISFTAAPTISAPSGALLKLLDGSPS